LAFSAVTGQMVYSYDSDGVAVNGENFTIANIVDVSGWNLAPTTPFLFYLVGGSGGATIGPVITTPDAYFTNFIVYSGAAVPEPAVTAVLAGIITLGFAVWLRRRRV